LWKGWVGGGRRILKWIAKEWGRRMVTGFMWLRVGVIFSPHIMSYTARFSEKKIIRIF
jgi:hypothetical protein